MRVAGVFFGLACSIVFILRKGNPALGLMLGALAGALAMGASLSDAALYMTEGAAEMAPAVVRILAAGVLSGALIESGAAEEIAGGIIRCFGGRGVLPALALATMVLAACGVFLDVAILTIAPVALASGRRAGCPREALLLAMVGGGKAGNLVSPNPNTIAVAGSFGIDLSSLMAANIVPCAAGVVFAVFLSVFLSRRLRNGEGADSRGVPDAAPRRFPFALCRAFAGPCVAAGLLALRPLCGISVDPLFALPAGGAATALAMGCGRKLGAFSSAGMEKMTPVVVLLLATGTFAGCIRHSALTDSLASLLSHLGIPLWALAPVSGILMSAATASTTAGATVAATAFSGILSAAGLPPLGSAAMLHAGATALDQLPHGSFFHVTAGACGLNLRARMRLVLWEASVGLLMTLAGCLLYVER